MTLFNSRELAIFATIGFSPTVEADVCEGMPWTEELILSQFQNPKPIDYDLYYSESQGLIKIPR